MTAAKPRTTFSADRINLVDENDTRRILFRLLKQIAHTGRADADKHLYKIRPADCKKRHTGFARRCFGNISLAGTRRTDQKDTLRNPCAKFPVFSWILEEINNLFKFFLFLVKPGNISESHFPPIALFMEPSPAFPKLHDLSPATGGIVHHVVQEKDDDPHEKDVWYRRNKPVAALRRRAAVIDIPARKLLPKISVHEPVQLNRSVGVADDFIPVFQLGFDDGPVNHHFFDLFGLEFVN